MATNFKPAQLQAFVLAGAGAVLGDTTITFTNMNSIDGVALAMTDFGSKGWMTLEANNSTQEEQISFTGLVQNANGTATISGVKNVGFLYPYTETTGLAKTHAGGTPAIVSNSTGFYTRFVSVDDNETINQVYTFASGATPIITDAPVGNTDAANKAYVDSVAVAGAPNANTTTKGIIQIATGAQAAAGTATGSTGAILVPSNSLYNATSSATILIPVTNSSGKLSSGFGGAASSLATLDGSSLVVQNPANATATPTSGKIPISSGSTVLDVGWIDTGVTASKILKLDGSAKIPAVDGSQLTNLPQTVYKNGIATQTATSTTTLNIAHGLGVTPKNIRITAVYIAANSNSSTSTGVYNGTTTSCVYTIISNTTNNNAGAGSGVLANAVLVAATTSISNTNAATVTFDATNIILAWTINGSMGSGSITILWEAEARV